jgi:hypothetical protein
VAGLTGGIVFGIVDGQIAERLVVSHGTVRTHVARILMKLDLRDRVQAVVLAYETGIVTPGKYRPHSATLTTVPDRPQRFGLDLSVGASIDRRPVLAGVAQRGLSAPHRPSQACRQRMRFKVGGDLQNGMTENRLSAPSHRSQRRVRVLARRDRVIDMRGPLTRRHDEPTRAERRLCARSPWSSPSLTVMPFADADCRLSAA